jgi:hypothetical protein
MLGRVLNLKPGDLVLAGGWHLQALNPIGPYPMVNVCGASEAGKSTTSKYFLRATDPNSAGLRRPSRKVQDMLLAAKNNWIIGLDNMSWMTAEASDTFCMISTGIASGTRAHYTNDEEHVYEVMRPMLFNGIAGNLIERSDLASRTIKLQIPAIAVRRGPADLEEEFLPQNTSGRSSAIAVSSADLAQCSTAKWLQANPSGPDCLGGPEAFGKALTPRRRSCSERCCCRRSIRSDRNGS